jgi:c-di-GMP phosphodiesterase
MDKEIYVARQPILNGNNELFAYELLYRDAETDNLISDNRSATARVLVNILNQFNLDQILGSTPAFIKVDGAFLMQDMIYSIPKERFVLALFEDIKLSNAIIERITYFAKEGWKFAINDTSLDNLTISNFQTILPYLSYWKIDTRTTDLEALNVQSLIQYFKERGIACIATKVESLKTFHLCQDLGFDYFQGYYFSRPRLLSHKTFDTEQAVVMKIWQLVMGDAPLKETAEAFEANPILTAQLLNYINSAAFSFRNPIKSIPQVLTLLGRMALMQWMLLTINARKMSSPKQQEPLQALLINRIEIMLGLFRLMPEQEGIDSHEVHFVGLLSFIDILLGIPLDAVLNQLNVDPVIRQALDEGSGVLGELLTIAQAIEHFDTEALDRFLVKYDIAPDDVLNLTLKTIEKVNSFDAAL